MQKKKLLVYSDSANCSTGFGNVARHVLSRVLDRYEICMFGVNEYFNSPNPLPVRTIPALPNAQNDPFGKQKFVEFIVSEGANYDIWFLQNDIHSWGNLAEIVMNIRGRGKNPHIFTYTVVDGPIRKEDTWFLSCVDVGGIPSEYGIREILRHDPHLAYKLRHIPHGVDSNEFFPLPDDAIKKFKKDVMGCDEDDFLIVNVNRNSSRKDIVRSLMYFGHLHKKRPNAKMYLHMERDEEQYKGWNLNRVLETNRGFFRNVSFPKDFSVNQGVNLQILNSIYNAADLVISTTLGEGFGLSCVEAMAAGTLVMMPDNSSLSELMADGRGLPIKCGSTSSEWTIQTNDLGCMRPLSNIDDMVEKTIQVIDKYPIQIVDKARKWVNTELNWERVVNLFINGFENPCPITDCEGRIEL